MQTVSWIRQKDLHVLTVGRYAFSTDRRFSSNFKDDNWNLKINKVQIRDTGDYECQLSTNPIKKTLVHLKVKG